MMERTMFPLLVCVLLLPALLEPVAADETSGDDKCNFWVPKHYISYHLKNEPLDIDGKLDEIAWEEVAWSDVFEDIQGDSMPKPRFNTRAKMRYDDQYLYIGAMMEETDVWANETKHNAVVFHDNDFEVFIDPDGSTHNYKELEVNAINTTWDLLLDKPYLDGGKPNNSWEMPMKSSVFVEGPVNDPSKPNRYWTLEMALPLKSYVERCFKATAPPRDGDTWRINFSRVEWHVDVVDGHYEKVPNTPEDNWVWTPQLAINMHLPEKWGFLQFSEDKVNHSKFALDPVWPQRSIAMEIYDAEKKFYVENGYYTSQLDLLELDARVTSGECAEIPTISTDGPTSYSFQATIKALHPNQPTIHVRDDRLIWEGGMPHIRESQS